MNDELKELLFQLLSQEDKILDDDFFYDAEFDSLIKLLDEIIANDD